MIYKFEDGAANTIEISDEQEDFEGMLLRFIDNSDKETLYKFYYDDMVDFKDSIYEIKQRVDKGIKDFEKKEDE